MLLRAGCNQRLAPGGLLGALEVLDRALVFFSSLATVECPKVAALARFGIFLPRVEPVLS